VGRTGWAAVAAIGLAGLLAPVPGAAQLEMYGTPGDAIAPWLARARGGVRGAARVDSPWFRDRAGLPDVPPTTPPLFAKPPIVVFFTVDAFRWDLVDSDTYEAELPVLHRLRDEGAYLREARSPSPTTVTSISTIFTGRFYSQLYWTEQTGGGHQKLFPWQDDTSRVEALLNARKVATTLVVSGTGFADKYGLTPGFGEAIGKGSPVGIPAAQITAAVIKRLEKQGEGPLFVYSHYFEPHAPYDRGGKEGTEFERYVKEVKIVDAELDKLLAAVDRLGMKDRFVLIVTADHGEAFGEHGTKEHGTTLYDELIRVPLLIHGAGVTAKRVDARVSGADLGPTILDLFGAPTPAKFLGQSLVPLLRGEAPKLERPVVAESGRSMRSMYYDDDTVLIEDRRLHTTELFDLAKDPGELKNLWSADDAKARQKLDRLHAFFEAHELHRPGYELPYRP
jgi:arylsulfatase A-like enzyme